MSTTKKADVMVYDIETWPNLFLFGVQRPDEKDTLVLEISPRKNEWEEIVEILTEEERWFVGYNNTYFDDVVMNYFLHYQENMSHGRPWEDLADFAQMVINDDRRAKRFKYMDKFWSFDLMKVAGLYKSLKMVAINLRWPLIQDLPYDPLEPIPEEAFDDAVLYNVNDVQITEALYQSLKEKINLRSEITHTYGVNVMNESRSGIANRLLEHEYSKVTGVPAAHFTKLRTRREIIAMEDVVLPQISFMTKPMQKWLASVKEQVISTDTKFKETIRIGNSVYDIAKGGLHSNNPSNIQSSDEHGTLRDADVKSYYPRLMIEYGIRPAHLSKSFTLLLEEFTNTRLEAKANMDWLTSEALKIVINSIFGKMGFENHWLYDPLAMYRVTLNGQLFLLMLIEALEHYGIPVFYANTDGITAKVKDSDTKKFYAICERWEKFTRFDLEYEEFNRFVCRDVNNYIVEKKGGDLKMKGSLDIERWKDLSKKYEKPIVAEAIKRYFIDGVPPEQVLDECDDPLDYCMAQKPGAQFDIVFDYIDEETSQLTRTPVQRANRYYVSKGGGSLVKVKENGRETMMVAGESLTILNDVENGDRRPIDRRYYLAEIRKAIAPFVNEQTSLF